MRQSSEHRVPPRAPLPSFCHMVYLRKRTLTTDLLRCQDAEAPETIDGIRVKRSGKRAKGGAGAPARPRVEKAVVNCLACGKVYDCRPVTNDIIMFLGAHAAVGMPYLQSLLSLTFPLQVLLMSTIIYVLQYRVSYMR